MKKYLILVMVLISYVSPSYAILGAIVQGAKTVHDEAYKRFMMINQIKQLKTLRDNYVASKRYYEKFRELNEGQGFVKNISNKIVDIEKAELERMKDKFEKDWFYDPAINSDVDKFIGEKDDYIADKIKFVSQSVAHSIENFKKAEDLAVEAPLLDSKGTRTALVTTQSLQIQGLAQINRTLAILTEIQTKLLKIRLDEMESRIRERNQL